MYFKWFAVWRQLVCFILFFFSLSVSGNDQLLFNVNSVTIQQGDGFELGDDRRKIITLDHASVWRWGDVYAFYDYTKENDSNQKYFYYEISPRISLKKFGLSSEWSTIKDVLIATTFERGQGNVKAYLIGPGVTWNLAAGKHLETNVYARNNPNLTGSTWQMTTAWSIPFDIKGNGFLFDGYLDVRGDEGTAKGDFNFNPQLKLDVGRYTGFRNVFYVGVEYYYWNNKFGISGVDERALAILLQARHSF